MIVDEALVGGRDVALPFARGISRELWSHPFRMLSEDSSTNCDGIAENGVSSYF